MSFIEDSFRSPAHHTDCNRRTYTTKLVKSGKPDKKLDRKKPVLVERRIINHKGQHTHTEVDVKSPALRDVLIEMNKDVEGLSLLREPPFVSPHRAFRPKSHHFSLQVVCYLCAKLQLALRRVWATIRMIALMFLISPTLVGFGGFDPSLSAISIYRNKTF